MIKPYIAVFSLLACMGCHSITSVSDSFDKWSFSSTGGTVFSDPSKVTTKQLHFDTGQLFGKDVILEGNVEYFGASFTHLLLADKEGKVLVVTTELPESYKEFTPEQKPRLRILGRLERGKKGLPYLLAHSVDTVRKSAN